ncbi:MAG: hypothetical protein V4620_00665 [Bacteroidota bacterium]
MTKFLFAFVFLPFLSHNQTDYYDGVNGNLFLVPGAQVIFHDFATSRKYVLDSSHTVISAFDSTGRLVWSTNPRKDNGIKEYQIKQAFIDYLSFKTEDIGFNPQRRYKFFKTIQEYYASTVNPTLRIISISYNNSQFGVLNMDTGKFVFYGQD